LRQPFHPKLTPSFRRTSKYEETANTEKKIVACIASMHVATPILTICSIDVLMRCHQA
jgi:hypothetical protein